MVRVVVADDHPLIREALGDLLDQHPTFALVGRASSGYEVLDLVRQGKVDVVLLDLAMPGRGGLETLKELKRNSSPPKVLMLTAHIEDEIAVRCMKAGADGYVSKDQGVDYLIEAIEKVAGGGKVISPELAELIAMSFDPTVPKPPHHVLSNRELEVMCRIAMGQTPSEIAEELFLSVKTVSAHRACILRKMGLRNSAELMHYAYENGLIE